MNIVERGKAFLQGLRALAGRTAWDWRRCPRCGDTLTCKWGHYERHPWTLAGRPAVRVQRHRCEPCSRAAGRHVTYASPTPHLRRGVAVAGAGELVRARGAPVRHRPLAAPGGTLGTSVRKTAEVLRSWLGKQERWRLWRPLDPGPADDRTACHLGASTVERWLDQAGEAARRTVPGQLAGVPTSGQFTTDGLWARFRGGAKGVVLALVDGASGLVWPPVVVAGEEAPGPWARLFRRARVAGLDLHAVHGLTSDGAPGLEAYRRRVLPWVSHQRCVFHLWHGLAGAFAQAVATAAAGLTGAAAKAVRAATRRQLDGLVQAVFDASSWAAAEVALATLAAHDLGAALATALQPQLEAALYHLCGYNAGLVRVSPEWVWRDFRLRLSHGRNHGHDRRLERAALVWAISRNFEPAQGRCERKRKYRHPGRCPLAVAGVPPGDVSSLDALGI